MAAILVAVLLVDGGTTVYAFAAHRPDPPLLPVFSSQGINRGPLPGTNSYAAASIDGPSNYDYPSMVVDAHLTAMFGLYYYCRMTADPTAARLFDGGASTLVSRLPHIRRPGSVSNSALMPGIYELNHHWVVAQQLAVLARMTTDERFAAYSRQFAKDAS
jgi:hypothetical protein